MSTQALEFKIDLSGNLAAKLTDANKHLHESGEHAKHAKHEFEGFEAEIGNLGGALGGLGVNFQALSKGGHFFTFDLAEGLESVLEIVHKVIEGVVDLGKEMIVAAGKTQDLNLAIELTFGEEGAKQIDELAEIFAEKSQLTAAEFKKAILPLGKQGIKDEATIDTIATVATDLAARNNTGVAGVQRTIDAFAGLFQKGRIKPAGLAEFGISASGYFSQLAASLHTTVDKAQKMAKAGKVSQDKLAQLAIAMVAEKQGGSIGDPTRRSGATLGTSLNNLQALPETLFERVAKGPGMTEIQRVIDSFLHLMGGEAGTAMVQRLDHLFGELAKTLTEDKIKGAIDWISSKIEWLASPDGVSAIVTGFKGFLVVVEGIAKAIASIVEGVASLVNQVSGKKVSLLGIDFDTSDAKGTSSKFATAAQTVPKVAAALGVPLFGGGMDLAQAGGKGIADLLDSVPHMASGGIVNRPTLALIGESGPESVTPLSHGQSGGGHTFVFSPNIQTSANESDIRDQLTVAEQDWRIELKKFLDEGGASFGVQSR